MQLQLLSVNIGRPKIIAAAGGEPVLSAIAKHRVTDACVFVGATDIAGDEQADLSVHGGIDKAVYAYPSEHWSWWEREHSLPCVPGTFGENLTLAGADETQISVGDRFAWGTATLEISQPRSPCFKLAIHTGREDVPQSMVLSGRCGWYLRVLQEGEAPADAPMARIFASGGASVREVFFARHHRLVSKDILQRAYEAPGLTQSWVGALGKRLDKSK